MIWQLYFGVYIFRECNQDLKYVSQSLYFCSIIYNSQARKQSMYLQLGYIYILSIYKNII